MSGDNNNLPTMEEGIQIPTFLNKKQWFNVNIDNDFLDFAEPYRPPRYTLSRKGVPFADVGDLHIITGKPGHGKTGLISQIMAAVLCGKFGNTDGIDVPRKVKDKDGNITEKIIEKVVLYIDTEQGKDDTIAIKNRVCTLAGIDYTKPCKNFHILRLRDTEEADERWLKILKAVWMLRPSDIFLDGMLDIVKDYNDQKECQPIVRECMMLATEYDASLWAVLHENPMVDKLVGTLGSIVQRKVSEIFAVRKIKQSDLKPSEHRPDRPEIYFQVKQLKARGKDVMNWDFEYVTNIGGWGMPVELDDSGSHVNDPEAVKRDREMRDANALFKDFTWERTGVTYTSLENHLKLKHAITSGRQIKKWFDIAREAGIIYKGNNGKYFYNGLQNDVPNTESEYLPFNDGKEECPF